MTRFFAYCRKSSEAEDRQVLSIQSQTSELEALAERSNGQIVEILSESRSAKEPGRPIFNEMMKRIYAGEADGILCWKLDRLARNPIDGGTIIWAVNHQGIQIVTPTQTFQKNDETVVLMWIELGMAHKYIIDLGKNCKRGMKTKAEMGWMPALAPLGYINRTLANESRVIAEDPERFALVRRMWDLLLTGQYSVQQILDTATNQWGLLSRPTRKRAAKAFTVSGMYRMFTNKFYYGEFEHPHGSSRWYTGAHKPLVSRTEFEAAQLILGRGDRSRSQHHTFAFTGLIRCGGCGAMVTAEEKWKYQKNGNKHRYVYYHCTKRKRPRCTEGSIEEKRLIEQVTSFLAAFDVSQVFKEFAVKMIDEVRDEEGEDQLAIVANLEERGRAIEQSLRELTKMRYEQLINNEEFDRERRTLLLEQSQIKENIETTSRGIGGWREPAKYIYEMIGSIRSRFIEGTSDIRKDILARVGSNLILKDQKLIILAKKPFLLVQKWYQLALKELGGFEPPKQGLTYAVNPKVSAAFSIWCSSVNEVRTYFLHEARKKVKKDPQSSRRRRILLRHIRR